MEFKHSKDMPLGDGKPCKNPWMDDSECQDTELDVYRMKVEDIKEEDVKRAFLRFEEWLELREIPKEIAKKYMLMYFDGSYYQFKNINTRNYIYVNVLPTPFNR